MQPVIDQRSSRLVLAVCLTTAVLAVTAACGGKGAGSAAPTASGSVPASAGASAGAAGADGAGATGAAGGANGGSGAAAGANGVEAKEAGQIIAAVRKASAAATSVHVVGDLPDKGKIMTVDLRTGSGGRGAGDFTIQGKRMQVLRIGATAYIKGDDAFWRSAGGAQAVAVFSGKYLKVKSSSKDFKDLTSLTDTRALFDLILGDVSGTIVKGEQTRIRGVAAIALKDGTGSVVYVATEGEPYVLQLRDGTHVVDFLDYNKKVAVTAPPAARIVKIPAS